VFTVKPGGVQKLCHALEAALNGRDSFVCPPLAVVRATSTRSWWGSSRTASASPGIPPPVAAQLCASLRHFSRSIRIRLTRGNRRSAPDRLWPRTGVADVSCHSGTLKSGRVVRYLDAESLEEGGSVRLLSERAERPGGKHNLPTGLHERAREIPGNLRRTAARVEHQAHSQASASPTQNSEPPASAQPCRDR
jgi:hypothetical protein